MARFVYQAAPPTYPLAPSVLRRWAPSLGLWGIGAGAAITLFMSDVPVFRQDVLFKVPFVKQYYVDDTPASDKPF